MEPLHWKRTLAVVALFAIAMGFLEAAVVVYLRLHFYPNGFTFPLAQMPADVLAVEVAREAATLVMLACTGWIAGRGMLSRWAYAAFAFGVWDLFYYLFLKLVLDWPASFLTDDILFLIPVPWIGPVLAPAIVSCALIGGSVLLLWREAKGKRVSARPVEYVLICLGGLVVVASFLLDAGAGLYQQLPGPFPWYLFASGMLLGVLSFVSWLGRGSRDQAASRATV